MNSSEINYPLSDPQWLLKHEQELKTLFGSEFSPVNHDFLIRVGYRFKLLGVGWHTYDDFGIIMAFLEKLGIIVRQEQQVKATDKPFIELFEQHYQGLEHA